jgi:hypothetical protein
MEPRLLINGAARLGVRRAVRSEMEPWLFVNRAGGLGIGRAARSELKAGLLVFGAGHVEFARGAVLEMGDGSGCVPKLADERLPEVAKTGHRSEDQDGPEEQHFIAAHRAGPLLASDDHSALLRQTSSTAVRAKEMGGHFRIINTEFILLAKQFGHNEPLQETDRPAAFHAVVRAIRIR